MNRTTRILLRAALVLGALLTFLHWNYSGPVQRRSGYVVDSRERTYSSENRIGQSIIRTQRDILIEAEDGTRVWWQDSSYRLNGRVVLEMTRGRLFGAKVIRVEQAREDP